MSIFRELIKDLSKEQILQFIKNNWHWVASSMIGGYCISQWLGLIIIGVSNIGLALSLLKDKKICIEKIKEILDNKIFHHGFYLSPNDREDPATNSFFPTLTICNSGRDYIYYRWHESSINIGDQQVTKNDPRFEDFPIFTPIAPDQIKDIRFPELQLGKDLKEKYTLIADLNIRFGSNKENMNQNFYLKLKCEIYPCYYLDDNKNQNFYKKDEKGFQELYYDRIEIDSIQYSKINKNS